jgi:hypothetical protein
MPNLGLSLDQAVGYVLILCFLLLLFLIGAAIRERRRRKREAFDYSEVRPEYDPVSERDQ